MSRTATATPPPAYFPQRNSTPTLLHRAPPGITAAHFPTKSAHHEQKRGKKIRQLPSSFNGLRGRKSEVNEQDKTPPAVKTPATSYLEAHDSSDAVRSSFSSAESTPETSLHTPSSNSTSSLDSPIATENTNQSSQQLPTVSIVPATPATPASSTVAKSWYPNFNLGKVAKAVVASGISIPSPFSHDRKKESPTKVSVSPAPSLPVLPELVHTHSAPIISARPPSPNVSAEFAPSADLASVPSEFLAGLNENEAQNKKREWLEAEHRRLTECARLCSQWPQSGYNISKFGPNGAKHFYEPQSYANPPHVQAIMSRQTDLERHYCENGLLFFPSRRNSLASDRRGSRVSSLDTSVVDSFDNSALPSPTTSLATSHDVGKVDETTAENLRLAMASPIMGSPNPSQNSLLLPAITKSGSPKKLKNVKSLTELDIFASSMYIGHSSRQEDMEVDTDTTSLAPSLAPSLVSNDDNNHGRPKFMSRPARAASCGSKRPSMSSDAFEGKGNGNEEEKRRRVDEAMVVDEAIQTGVIMPASPIMDRSIPRLCASTPDLSAVENSSSRPSNDGDLVQPASVFGHVVKTSETHPIIISPFFPSEILPTLSKNIVVPINNTPNTIKPFQLSSKVDVPSMLLSYLPTNNNGSTASLIPSPVSSQFTQNMVDKNMDNDDDDVEPRLGNLLLSSCPGKRLRMEGPIKGRGPVCRDLKTDLSRIKAEGVGCLVCCLDDPELALLGVPWETYRDVAFEIGLDVIRLPMPDGFTPVSLALFDAQVTLIASKYTLHGINVLVHCRGGVGRAGLTACAWAIKMGFVQPHPSLSVIEEASTSQNQHQQHQHHNPEELEHQIIMSIVERVIAMIRSRRGLKAIESFEQVQFLAAYVRWLRSGSKEETVRR